MATFAATPSSPTRYLGRMSWDTSLLEVSRGPGSPLQAPLLANGASTACATASGEHNASAWFMKSYPRTQHVLTHDEAMLEVQQMLDAQLHKHKRVHNSPNMASQVSIITKSERGEATGRVDRGQFAYSPLRDPKMLLEAAQTELETRESESDDDDSNTNRQEERESTRRIRASFGAKAGSSSAPTEKQQDLSDQVMERQDTDLETQKYFGAGAKEDYYKTYRELHGKTHLFVQVQPQPASSPASRLQSSSSCPATLDNRSLSPPALSPSRSGVARHHTRQRHIPPLGEGGDMPNRVLEGQSSSLSAQSPRVLFLASCLAKSRPALSLVLRKANSRTFDFSHQGLGDGFMVDFAACLPEIPLVEAINVRDNALSDHAIDALLHALENKPHLSYLNLSGNAVGLKSAASLRAYIASSLCTLKTLVLDAADVSDVECALFMMAFERNKSVQELSLQSNAVGQPQLQQSLDRKSQHTGSLTKTGAATNGDRRANASGQPTGGEAIGAMLNVNLHIQRLDLSWNMLRAASAVPIATALQLNYHLRELTLTHNSIGDDGALAFGQALRSNSTLQKLRLEYNAIGRKGALGLSSGLAANSALVELALDGNPLGLEAAKALMRASCARASTSAGNSAFCRLSLMECNLMSTPIASGKKRRARNATDKTMKTQPSTHSEQLAVFNPSAPVGSYVLSLAEPYENVVAHELFRLARDEIRGSEFRFARIEFTSEASGSSKPSTVKLEHVKVLQKPDNEGSAAEFKSVDVSEGSSDVSSTQRHRSKSAVAMLFNQVDADRSGSVDHVELLQAMRSHGISVADADLARLLREYDYDGSGSLQAGEFSDLFFRCGFAMIDADGSGSLDHREVSRVLSLMGIHDVSEAEITRMLARYDLDNSGEIDEQEFLAFLKAEILGSGEADSMEEGGSRQEGASASVSTLMEHWILRDVTNGAEFTIGKSGKLSLELVHDPTPGDDGDNVNGKSVASTRLGRRISDAFVSKLLTNVQGVSKNMTEQREFLHLVLEESELLFSSQQAMALLAKQAGALKTQRRRLESASRLLPQIASRQDAANLVAQLVDAQDQWLARFALRSRLGRWFPVLLGSLTNAYTFDLGREDDRSALKRLAQQAQAEKLFSKNRSGRGDTSQHGDWENFRHASINGKPVLLTSSFILNSLLGPSSSSLSAGATMSQLAESKTVVSFYYVSTQRPPRGTQPLSRRRFEQLQRVLQQQLPSADTLREFIAKVWAEEAERDLSVEQEASKERARMHWRVLRRSVVKRDDGCDTGSQQQVMMQQLRASLEQTQSRLALLEMLVAERWLSCQQALELVASFPNALHARAKAACVLFSRVIDLHNFIQIYDVLLPEDQRECVRRLGWLNMFDPTQPDRDYPPLDLGVRDERELVQILAQLSVHEASCCWRAASYRVGLSHTTSEREPPTAAAAAAAATASTTGSTLPLPGWGNPDAIGSEALRHHGVVKLRFQSDRQDIGQHTKGESHGEAQVASGSASERDALRRELRRRVLCGTRLFL